MSDAVTADLIDRLLLALCDGFTKQGHAAQILNNREHMGGCKPGACLDRCRAWRALRDEATAYLERYADGLEPAPRQMAMVEVASA